jgi:hypothetical protein
MDRSSKMPLGVLILIALVTLAVVVPPILYGILFMRVIVDGGG